VLFCAKSGDFDLKFSAISGLSLYFSQFLSVGLASNATPPRGVPGHRRRPRKSLLSKDIFLGVIRVRYGTHSLRIHPIHQSAFLILQRFIPTIFSDFSHREFGSRFSLDPFIQYSSGISRALRSPRSQFVLVPGLQLDKWCQLEGREGDAEDEALRLKNNGSLGEVAASPLFLSAFRM